MMNQCSRLLLRKKPDLTSNLKWPMMLKNQSSIHTLTRRNTNNMKPFSGIKNTTFLHTPIDPHVTNETYTSVRQITRLRNPRQVRHVDLRSTREMEAMTVDLTNTGSTGTDIRTITVITREIVSGTGIVIVNGTETKKDTTGTIRITRAKAALWRTENVIVSDILEIDPRPLLDGTRSRQGTAVIN